MAYTPTNWSAGDVITSQKLNKLEQGVVDAYSDALTVIATPVIESGQVTNYSFSKTLEEIFNASYAGNAIQCIIKAGDYSYNTETIGFTGSIPPPGYTFVKGITFVPIRTNNYVTPLGFSIRHYRDSNNEDLYDLIIGGTDSYILASTYGGTERYKVPMYNATDDMMYMDTVNFISDIGSTMEQLLLGAYGLASQSGTATLATLISDSETLSAVQYLVEEILSCLSKGRGFVQFATFGGYTVCMNFSSAFSVESTGECTISASMEVIDTNISNDSLNSADCYYGNFNCTVNYVDNDGIQTASNAVVVVHFDKHSATIV